MIEKEVDLNFESVSFTDLGKALTLLSQQLESYSTTILDRHKPRVKPSHSEPETVDPRLLDQQTRSQKIRDFANELQAAGVTQSEIRNLTKIQESILSIADASKQGLISSTEELESVKTLRKELVKAANRAHGDGGKIDAALENAGTETSVLDGLSSLTEGAGKRLGQIFGNPMPLLSFGGSGLAEAGVVGGGMALFGAMMFGYTEKNRLTQQYGEIANLASAAGGGSSEQLSRLAAFQEQAQHYYAISRSEIQSSLKTFVDAGQSFDAIFKFEGKGLGEVGSNALTMSIGLDKFFENGSGFASKNAVTLVRNYGETLDTAVNQIAGLEFSAKKAGIGVSNYINWTLQATGNVRTLGGNIEETASALIALKKRYQELGFTHEAAGRMANDAVQSLTSGLGSLSTGKQMWLAKELGYDQDLFGRQQLLSGLQNGETSFLEKATVALRQRALQESGGSETGARFVLQEQFGIKGEGARAVMELGKKFEKGEKLTTLKKEDRESLRNAFTDEGHKSSDIQKNTREVMDGISQIGQGLLAILGGFIGIAIVGMKALPLLLFGSKDEHDRAIDALSHQMSGIDHGLHDVLAGAHKTFEGMEHQIEPIIRPIELAINFQSKFSEKTEAVLPPIKSPASNVTIPAPGKPIEATPTVPKKSLPTIEEGSQYHPKFHTPPVSSNVHQARRGQTSHLKTEPSSIDLEKAIREAVWKWDKGTEDPATPVKVKVEFHG